jgi:hypothetical protein
MLGQRRFAQASADRAIDGLLERDAERLGALLQEPRQVVVKRESGPHVRHHR